MKRLKKLIEKLKMVQIFRPIIWAVIIIGSSLVFKGSENSDLILNFLISGAVIDLLYLSRSETVKRKCNMQEVA